MKTKKIPQTDSIEELARFWEMHDLTDFEHELEEITEPIFERGTETVMQIHLQPKELEVVEEIAKSKGIASADLIREWVRERIHLS